MAEKKVMRQPSSMAGLVKYEDDEKSLIKIKPIHVFGISVALILMEIILFLAFPI